MKENATLEQVVLNEGQHADKSRAWKKGWEHCLIGETRTNPYHLNTRERYEWFDGYDLAFGIVKFLRKRMV